jgi:hypothetical protein
MNLSVTFGNYFACFSGRYFPVIKSFREIGASIHSLHLRRYPPSESDLLRRQYVERAQYEAEQARVRYMRVDPSPGLWKDPGTSDRDRKRMARLIFEDVT